MLYCYKRAYQSETINHQNVMNDGIVIEINVRVVIDFVSHQNLTMHN